VCNSACGGRAGARALAKDCCERVTLVTASLQGNASSRQCAGLQSMSIYRGVRI
jgi:hypothetical protein